jgi:hypothetical protein
MRGKHTWKEIYNLFIEMGGDGFYALPQVTYKEPALKDITIHCPIAEQIQKEFALFKTNYRNLGEAKQQSELWFKLLDKLCRS